MSEPAPAPEPTAREERTSLRLAGFLAGALGGALVCIGALLPWARTGLEGLPEALTPIYYGIDLPDGLIVLALGLVMLVCLGVTRASRPGGTARWAALGLMTAAVLAVVVAGISLATSPDRLENEAVDEVLADLGPGGTATADQREQVDQLMRVRPAQGPFVALGGGALGALGGALLLRWARRDIAHADVRRLGEDRPSGM
ncbi:MAG TPA: Trp biosynthesis-associated membrane protein [Actinomycetota bacterium]